jgi:hypothetical protein
MFLNLLGYQANVNISWVDQIEEWQSRQIITRRVNPTVKLARLKAAQPFFTIINFPLNLIKMHDLPTSLPPPSGIISSNSPSIVAFVELVFSISIFFNFFNRLLTNFAFLRHFTSLRIFLMILVLR